MELAEYIAANYSGKVVEVGVGSYFEVAERLANAGLKVVTVDIVPRNAPSSVEFYVDDVSKPSMEIYTGASLIYSIRPPPEIFESIKRVAFAVNADCIIKPLYGDFPGGRLVNFRGLAFYLFTAEDLVKEFNVSLTQRNLNCRDRDRI